MLTQTLSAIASRLFLMLELIEAGNTAGATHVLRKMLRTMPAPTQANMAAARADYARERR